jgi:DNA-binding NtrC family response regulator
MSLPQILIIDDQYAVSPKDRDVIKASFALSEAEDSESTAHLGTVEFCRGLNEDGKFEVGVSLNAVKKGWEKDNVGARWSLVVVDYYFVEQGPHGGENIAGGKQIVRAIKNTYQDVPIVLFSTRDPEKVEAEVGDGVAFLQKPRLHGQHGDPKVQAELRKGFYRVLLQHGLYADQAIRYVSNAGDVCSLDSSRKLMLGSSLRFLKSLREARASLLTGRFPALLIEGAEGSGKDELVRYIHDWGRALALSQPDTTGEGKLVPFRIGEMTESEAAQVSVEVLKEKLEEAKRGTLHLDPIECLPASSQRFFTRWVEERIGDAVRDVSAPFQIIFTSSQPMQQLLERGLMGSSLADLLDVIEVPGVFDREDAIELLEYFLKEVWSARPQLSAESKDPPALNGAAKEIVAREKNWPGNVRQLRRVAAMLAARNEFRRSITQDEVSTCIKQTSSYRAPGARSGVWGLIDRIAAQAIRDNERLDGVFKEFRSAGSELVKRILLREAANQRYTRQRVARTLLDDDSIKDHGSFNKLKEWRDFFEIDETGDGRLDAMLAKPEGGGTRPK